MTRQIRLTLLLTVILAMVCGLGLGGGQTARGEQRAEGRGQKTEAGKHKNKKAIKRHKAGPAKKAKATKPHHPAKTKRPAKTAAKRHHHPTAARHSNGWERHPVSSARGRCEPQSLTYARERSGIMRSRTGHENGPLTWFASERKLGKVSNEPTSGSVLILGANTRHGMPTGHVAYVETAKPLGHSRYRITFSHTNYDRRCSMENDIAALYDGSAMTLDISSGAWRAWGQGLKVAGFIEQ